MSECFEVRRWSRPPSRWGSAPASSTPTPAPSCPAWRGADDRTFVDAMQRINVAILNGWFAIQLRRRAGAHHPRRGAPPPQGRSNLLPWIVAAFVLYGAILVITMGFNVPLNNELDAAGDPEHIADLAAVRERFEAAWVRWNIVRAVTATAGLGCLTWALVQLRPDLRELGRVPQTATPAPGPPEGPAGIGH